jgi:hypothetical protein
VKTGFSAPIARGMMPQTILSDGEFTSHEGRNERRIGKESSAAGDTDKHRSRPINRANTLVCFLSLVVKYR